MNLTGPADCGQTRPRVALTHSKRLLLTILIARLPMQVGFSGAIALTSIFFSVCQATAQGNPAYMQWGPVKALYYTPDGDPAPRVGVLVMHRTANYLTHPACTQLSARGFGVLCMNSRYENNEVAVVFEKLPLDVKQGVTFLRASGVEKVVLFAHSGGGPLMSLYQAVAEKGPAWCKGPDKLVECSDELADLPRADGIIFADAHPSNAILVLRALNPSVASEDNPPSAPPVAE
jgi:hypothetical protein